MPPPLQQTDGKPLLRFGYRLCRWRARCIGGQLRAGQRVGRGASVGRAHRNFTERRRGRAFDFSEHQAQHPPKRVADGIGQSPHAEHLRNGIGDVHRGLAADPVFQ